MAALVDQMSDLVASGSFQDGVDLIAAAMRSSLESIGDGATGSIVKENVRDELLESAERSHLNRYGPSIACLPCARAAIRICIRM